MRFTLQTRHRRIVILTGDDTNASEDTVADNTGGDLEVAPTTPPVFGFSTEGWDDE
jgi:hypothetical protein